MSAAPLTLITPAALRPYGPDGPSWAGETGDDPARD
jgi:hypothetical protein